LTIVVGSIAAVSQSVSLPSRPRFILFTGTNRTENDVLVTSGQCGGFLGMACNDAFGSETIRNYCEWAMIANAQNSSLSENCAYAQSAIGSFGTNTLYQGQVTSFYDSLLNPGFTITFTTSSPSHVVSYMAFCGIDGSMSFPYETACDGDPFLIDITVPPSLVVALGQWRNSCHVFPKSTSNQPWCSAGIADVAGGTGVLGAEWIYNTWSGGPNKLSQAWDNAVNQAGTTATLSAVSGPFVFNTTIPLGFIKAAVLGTTLNLNMDPGSGGGYDYAIAVLHSLCTRMECGGVGAGAEGSTQTFDLTEIGPPLEGVVTFNVEITPQIQANRSGRWGFGFASPLNQLSWMADGEQGCFYQTFQHGWVSSVTPTAVSFGDVEFEPSSDDIGFTTIENGGGVGASLWGAFRTYCDAPPIVSFSGFLTTRPSGTQITTRGGHITPGEGDPNITILP
jgi:hypothetical protein